MDGWMGWIALGLSVRGWFPLFRFFFLHWGIWVSAILVFLFRLCLRVVTVDSISWLLFSSCQPLFSFPLLSVFWALRRSLSLSIIPSMHHVSNCLFRWFGFVLLCDGNEGHLVDNRAAFVLNPGNPGLNHILSLDRVHPE
jgi:hypothetical protein